MKTLSFVLFFVVMSAWAFVLGYSHGHDDGFIEGNNSALTHVEMECVK